MKLKHEITLIDTSDEYVGLEVEFSGEPSWGNDSYSDEYGTVEKNSYVTMANSGNIEWDKTLHTDVENIIIAAFLADDKNREDLQDLFCSAYENECSND